MNWFQLGDHERYPTYPSDDKARHAMDSNPYKSPENPSDVTVAARQKRLVGESAFYCPEWTWGCIHRFCT